MNKALALVGLAFLLAAGCASSERQETVSQKKGDIYFSAGTEALENGNSTEALASLQEAVRFLPKSASAWNNLGLAFAAKGEDARAEESLKKSLTLDPKFTDARANLGALYIKTKKMKEAERQLKEALKDLVYPRLAQVHYNLATIYAGWRRPLLAEQQLKLALRADDKYCAAWFQLGMIQIERSEIDLAATSLGYSVAGTCFKNPRAHYEISSLYLKARETARAKSKLLDIINFFPESDWARKAEITLNMIR
jgi:Tfp pilus assembly protein PilF